MEITIKGDNKRLAAYTYSHFCVDGICAYLMWRIFGYSGFTFIWALVLYHSLAFAVQPFLGMICDHFPSLWAGFLGTSLTTCGILLSFIWPWAAVWAVGIGNTLFHVEGGYVSLLREDRRIAPGGIFVGGGAAGIGVGTLTGKFMGEDVGVLLFFVVLGLSSMALSFAARPDREVKQRPGTFHIVQEGMPVGLIVFFSFFSVLVRGYAGIIIPLPWKNREWMIILTSAMLLAGKMAGGFLGEKFGIRKTAVISMILSMAFLWKSSSMLPALAGLFFMNVPMSITLTALSDCLPEDTGLAFGIAPLALFLGYIGALAVKIPMEIRSPLVSILLAASACLLFLTLKGTKEQRDF
ncbi:hypothetical protein AALB16_08815 [Lachnospiraceae bacterium 62-35]